MPATQVQTPTKQPVAQPGSSTGVSGNSAVVEYLEDQLTCARERITVLERVLQVYRQHAIALAELTRQVFEEKADDNADTNQG